MGRTKIALSILLSLAMTNTASAVTSGRLEHALQEGFQVAVGYPGRDDTTGTTIDVSLGNVQLGAVYYRKVFGVWPASWAQVRESGIFQVQLPAMPGGNIDPDDQQLDFFTDIHYLYSPANSDPIVLVREDLISGNRIESIKINPTATYSEFLAGLREGGTTEEYAQYENDQEMLKLFAILGIASQDLSTFHKLHQRYPHDWREFMQSGIGPIDEHSINPVTHRAFEGHGGPGDVYYEQTSKDSFWLHHVNRDGSYPTFTFTY